MGAFLADFAVSFALGLSVFLILSSFRRRVPGSRIGRMAGVAFSIGVILLSVVLFLHGDQLARMFRALVQGSYAPFLPVLAAAIVLGMVLLAVPLGELAIVVMPERVVERMKARGGADRSRVRAADLVGGVLAASLALGSLTVAYVGESNSNQPNALPFDIVARYTLPSSPMDYESIDESTGYLTAATGEIYLVRLPTEAGEEPSYEEVASGLVFPRGVAIGGDILYVADLGPLHGCESPHPFCFGHTPEGEEEIIEASSGSLLAYQINEDLTLGEGREILTGLPIVNSEHGLNDVEVGPDGAIYLSVGNVDWMWSVPEKVRQLDHPKAEMLGTILRVDPDTHEASVYASGMRNVYGFDFDSTGRIIAADNDGPTTQGTYPEAILTITGGEDFGFPWSGGAGVTRENTPPLWQLTQSASTAVEWLDEGPWAPGLLIGGHDRVTFVEMAVAGDLVFVDSQDPETDVLSLVGYVTVIEQLSDSRLLVAATGAYGGTEDLLLILDLHE